MKLYLDDVLLSEDPKEDDLDAALDRLRQAGAGSLTLRGDGRGCLSATFDAMGWFLDVQSRDSLCFGMVVDGARAAEAFGEFLSGFTPLLPWKPVRPGRGDASHLDRPPCRMGL